MNEHYDQQFASFYMRDLELSEPHKGIMDYFRLQDELRTAVLNKNSFEALEHLKQLQSILLNRASGDYINALQRFYLSQMVLIADEMKQMGISPMKIFCFSSACIDMIYSWTEKEDLIKGGEWFIQTLIRHIEERFHPTYEHPLIRQAVKVVNQRLEDVVEVESIARELSVSPSHLAKVFRQEAGMTLKQFCHSRKVAEAKYYLHYSFVPISDISERFSFCNQSYFTKVFKEQTGMTPLQYRRQMQERRMTGA
ncbi:AraC family transcriptional regulator [Jeotgalibacillus sp. R-1-5s-1]|uniref:helix-turn-helix domain-containing protein n=1 Tax=Jeotgalibacillus sp. R-1-5s-1 TaxID=2555897 RepID=UPI00106C8F34|nr:AraC family transcriptional regulator [Jeotgalibacillus sp. R-1-5s-1]TFD99873.1 AraC family transcriptional regulator [Jeotgalibacillus sp. R-1-5s-1]